MIEEATKYVAKYVEIETVIVNATDEAAKYVEVETELVIEEAAK